MVLENIRAIPITADSISSKPMIYEKLKTTEENINPDKILFKGVDFKRVKTAIDSDFLHLFKHRNKFYQYIYIGE